MGEKTPQAQDIGEWMRREDRFAGLLGMELEETAPGYCRVSMTVTEDMLNAVGITHGGVTFGLADFAFAVASNSHDRVAVALSAQINFPAASQLGDRLTAEAREQSRTSRTGLYSVKVRKGDETLVGLFTGTVFRRPDSVSDWINGDQK